MRRCVSILAVLIAVAASVAQAREPRVQLSAAPTRSVRALIRAYRRNPRPARLSRAERLRFQGVGDRDVYNPTRPVSIDGKRVLLARVESRGSETDSKVMFFQEGSGAWRPIEGAPQLALQDPFVSRISGQVVVGGVETKEAPGGRRKYRTLFYRGKSMESLHRVTAGPWGMKDIRLAPLDDGRLFVLTRPQGKKGGRGRIGYLIVDRLEDLTPQAIAKAPLIEGQFLDAEWGGANEVLPLGRDRFGVLGHIARFDSRGNRHYYPVAFEIDAARGTVSESRILLERSDLPGGLRGQSKRRDLKDVLFSGGLQRTGAAQAVIYFGAGDAEVYRARIPDPFPK